MLSQGNFYLPAIEFQGRTAVSFREDSQFHGRKKKTFGTTSHLLQELGEVWLILVKACWMSEFLERSLNSPSFVKYPPGSYPLPQ